MKNTLILFFLLLTLNLGAQTIRIDFVPGCKEEFDIFFKKGFVDGFEFPATFTAEAQRR